MANLLFSPSGRIGPSAFLKGMGILAIIFALATLVSMFNFIVGSFLFAACIVLFIPMFFLVIKRLHDSGKSGWLSILFVILTMIISLTLYSVVGNFGAGDATNAMTDALEELMLSGATFAEIGVASQELTAEYGQAAASETSLLSAVGGFIGTMAAAFLINLVLKQDAHENQYGHPPAA